MYNDIANEKEMVEFMKTLKDYRCYYETFHKAYLKDNVSVIYESYINQYLITPSEEEDTPCLLKKLFNKWKLKKKVVNNQHSLLTIN